MVERLGWRRFWTLGTMNRFAFILVLLPGLLSGCESRTTPSTQPKSGFIAVVGVGQDDPYWPVIRGTALRTFHELESVGLSIRVEAPATSSVNSQRKILEQLRDKGVRGVCVQVTDGLALKTTLESMADRGIQITTMFGTVATSKPINRIVIDEDAVGRAVATALIDTLDGRGNIAVLHADSRGKSWTDRWKAFERQMSMQQGIRTLLRYDCGGDPVRAERIVRDTMERYPRLVGWAVMGNWLLIDQENKPSPSPLPDGCRMVACDPAPAVWPGFSRGECSAMVAGRYDELVEHAVTGCIGSVLNMNRATHRVAVGVRIVTREDLTQFKRDWADWSSVEATHDATSGDR